MVHLKNVQYQKMPYQMLDLSGEWMAIATTIAIDNIVPPYVEIRGIFDIEVWSSEGVNVIKKALIAAEHCAED